MSVEHKRTGIAARLASTELAISIFLLIAAVSIPATFQKQSGFYHSPFFLVLLAVFTLNLIVCTVRRFRTISRPVLLIHAGVIVTLCGAAVTWTGFVATANIFEGMSGNRFFRWDSNQDTDMDFAVHINKINQRYAPVPVKVGVLKGDVKADLITTRTGDTFACGAYILRVDSLDVAARVLDLTVNKDGVKIGRYSTSGVSDIPADFPYHFKLVAFQNPRLTREWVELELMQGRRTVAAGTSEVNHPFRWGGMYFYNIKNSMDNTGKPYAGIQIVRDPGRPVVFAGFLMVALGVVTNFLRRSPFPSRSARNES